MTLTDARLAATLAQSAGELLLALRSSSALSGKALSDHGDRVSDDLLLAELAKARPGDAVLSEESVDSPARLTSDRVWIIDPLDGSREYGLRDRSDWAVHVALWERDHGITAAAVAQPDLGAVYATDTIAASNVHHVSESFSDRPLILVSDSRPPAFAAAVAIAVHGELRPMGSAGAKAMAVVRGEADAYLHAGGQWEWDSAAPVGVVLAVGLHATRIDGSPLHYNSPRPYLPDLLICRRDLSAALLAAIVEATTPRP
ncbi:MAG: 3'(2'),5'-bisphosphate nucleotidase CysQ [Jatrophihabitantaceae bacterium]